MARKSGSACWEFLWRENDINGKRIRRTAVIGTVDQFPTLDLAQAVSNLTRGMTVVDRLDVSGDARNHDVWREALRSPKKQVCWSLNIAGWKSALMNSLT
jgi:hypothetical protein